jgi:hypothetical protein
MNNICDILFTGLEVEGLHQAKKFQASDFYYINHIVLSIWSYPNVTLQCFTLILASIMRMWFRKPFISQTWS